MPNDLHDKIIARLHRKPAVVKSFWSRASWGLAAAASLAFIFFVQNFEWPGNKNSEIVLKPASPALSTGVSVHAPSEADMASKSQTNTLANQQVALYTPKKEIAAKMRAEVSPSENIVLAQPAAPTAAPMVLAMASAPQAGEKAMVEKKMNANESFQSETTAGAPQAALATGGNDNGHAEEELNYRAAQPDNKQTPQFTRFDIIVLGLNKYQLNWQTDLVTKGQMFILDSTGNTLQAVAETTPFAYDHQMTIDVSTINTDFFIKVLASYLNGNQAVTVSTVLKPQ